MKAATKLTTKGQVVIPKEVRDKLKWRPGVHLEVRVTKEGLVQLRPKPEHDDFDALLDEICGSLDAPGILDELEADHREEIERDERHFFQRFGKKLKR